MITCECVGWHDEKLEVGFVLSIINEVWQERSAFHNNCKTLRPLLALLPGKTILTSLR